MVAPPKDRSAFLRLHRAFCAVGAFRLALSAVLLAFGILLVFRPRASPWASR